MTATIPFSSLHACPAAPVPVTGADSRPALSVREVPDLSEREIEVLRLITEELSDREIAERLSVSPRTVGGHVTRLLTKLDLESRTAAAVFAVRHDLI